MGSAGTVDSQLRYCLQHYKQVTSGQPVVVHDCRCETTLTLNVTLKRRIRRMAAECFRQALKNPVLLPVPGQEVFSGEAKRRPLQNG